MRYGIILKCFRMCAANFGLGIAKKLVLIKITIYTGGPRGPAMRVKGGLCGRKRLSAWDGYWNHQYKGGFHHGWGGAGCVRLPGRPADLSGPGHGGTGRPAVVGQRGGNIPRAGDESGADGLAGIRAIAVSSQTVTLLPLDAQGVPLRNAVIWMDGRCGGELKELLTAVGRQRLVKIVGGQPDSFFPNSSSRSKTEAGTSSADAWKTAPGFC